MAWSCVLAGLTCALSAVGCDSYDAMLIKPRDAGRGGVDIRDAATDADLDWSDGGTGCYTIEEGYPCAESCPESCNGIDDDCDGRVDEVDQRSTCQLPHALSVCVGSECLIAACLDGFVDCNSRLADGCETTLDSLAHCGVCRHSCERANTEVECDDGDCLQKGCLTGYADCDGKPDTGCERALDTLMDCGTCGNACEGANSVLECRDGECEFVECMAGFGDCDGDADRLGEGDGCETQLDSRQHCGACGEVCAGATPYCSGGKCSALRCDPDEADCDGDNVECETSLRSVTNCGACGVNCGPFEHAANGCGSGRCVMTCDSGFQDCDGSRSNGCETNIRTNTDCGRCGNVCSYPNATTSCSSGTCSLTACAPGYGDCNSDLARDGCEQRLNTPAHCGQCGRACSLANATASCSSSSCQVGSCNDNFGNCDGQADNGCEVNLASSAQHCGSCNFACPNGQSCTSGRCVCASDAQCGSGQICCNGACVNTSDDEANCGACGIMCASSQTCCSGSCRDLGSDRDNCGSCGKRCGSNSNRCDNGSCRCTDDAPCALFYSCCARGCSFASCL